MKQFDVVIRLSAPSLPLSGRNHITSKSANVSNFVEGIFSEHYSFKIKHSQCASPIL